MIVFSWIVLYNNPFRFNFFAYLVSSTTTASPSLPGAMTGSSGMYGGDNELAEGTIDSWDLINYMKTYWNYTSYYIK